MKFWSQIIMLSLWALFVDRFYKLVRTNNEEKHCGYGQWLT